MKVKSILVSQPEPSGDLAILSDYRKPQRKGRLCALYKSRRYDGKRYSYAEN